jgi:hypothetical protein
MIYKRIIFKLTFEDCLTSFDVYLEVSNSETGKIEKTGVLGTIEENSQGYYDFITYATDFLDVRRKTTPQEVVDELNEQLDSLIS